MAYANNILYFCGTEPTYSKYMFSGIIEDVARVVGLERDKTNLHITLTCRFAGELKVDQSVAHNGVCLTVVSINGDTCRAILSYKGVMYKKHLLGGVAKGAFTETKAEARFNKWMEAKAGKIEAKTNKLATDAKSAEKARLAAEAKIKEERAAAIAEKKAAAEAAAREAAEAAAAETAAEEAAPEAPAAE